MKIISLFLIFLFQVSIAKPVTVKINWLDNFKMKFEYSSTIANNTQSQEIEGELEAMFERNSDNHYSVYIDKEIIRKNITKPYNEFYTLLGELEFPPNIDINFTPYKIELNKPLSYQDKILKKITLKKNLVDEKTFEMAKDYVMADNYLNKVQNYYKELWSNIIFFWNEKKLQLEIFTNISDKKISLMGNNYQVKRRFTRIESDSESLKDKIIIYYEEFIPDEDLQTSESDNNKYHIRHYIILDDDTFYPYRYRKASEIKINNKFVNETGMIKFTLL